MSRTRGQGVEGEDGCQGATAAMPPRVIIEQPNGSIDMGVDFSRVPKETHRTHSDVTEESDAAGAAAVAEDFARAQEEGEHHMLPSGAHACSSTMPKSSS
jgi:hypothetical protein